MWYDMSPLTIPQIPEHMYMKKICLSAMLPEMRLVGVTPEVNLGDFFNSYALREAQYRGNDCISSFRLYCVKTGKSYVTPRGNRTWTL